MRARCVRKTGVKSKEAVAIASRIILPGKRTEEGIGIGGVLVTGLAPEECVGTAERIREARFRAEERIIYAGRVRLSGVITEE